MNGTFVNEVSIELIDPPASQVTAQSSWYEVGADLGDRLAFKVSWGAVGTSITAAVTQATDTSAGSEKAVTGASLSTILTANANKWGIIDLGPGAFDLANGFIYASCTVTASGTVVWQLELIRYRMRYPGSFTDPTTLQEAVQVYFQS